jgi:esterase
MIPQPEDRWIRVNGIRLHYLDWGNSSAPPMILLHGFCSYARYWDFFARNMSPEYHVLALDMRGHGDSEHVSSYSLEDVIADLVEFVEALKLKNITLIGLSMGGLISIPYTVEHGDKLARLVIVDIGPELDPEGLEHINKDLASEPAQFASADEAFGRLQQVQPLNSEEFIHHQVKYALKPGEDAKLKFKYDSALCRLTLQSQENLWEYLERIKCPTLVIRAEHSDILSRATAQKMIALLPKGSLAEIPSTTHTLVGDNPEAFEKEVRAFLKSDNNK